LRPNGVNLKLTHPAGATKNPHCVAQIVPRKGFHAGIDHFQFWQMTDTENDFEVSLAWIVHDLRDHPTLALGKRLHVAFVYFV